MMFRGGGTIEQPKRAWRRATFPEAFTSGCVVFTVVTLTHALAAAFGLQTDAARAFIGACSFGLSSVIASLLFKSRVIYLR